MRAVRSWPSTGPGQLARELGVVVIASLFERRSAGLFTTITVAVLGTDGEVAGIYRKMHIPMIPLYYRKVFISRLATSDSSTLTRPLVASGR